MYAQARVSARADYVAVERACGRPMRLAGGMCAGVRTRSHLGDGRWGRQASGPRPSSGFAAGAAFIVGRDVCNRAGLGRLWLSGAHLHVTRGSSPRDPPP